MKKLLLLFTIATALSAPETISAQTNVYHPFPDSNAVWNYNVMALCWNGGYINQDYSITFSGDTTLNSQTYHKLTTPFIMTYTTGNCSGIAQAGYKGAVRQDTAARKVFIVPPGDTTEQLLYDFNLQVGDTVTGYIAAFSIQPDVVSAIDSVLVGNTYRKRWEINIWYNIYYIEGIGSTFGLLEQSPGNLTDFPGYTLSCFSQNNQSLYPATTPNCNLITATTIHEKQTPAISVYPNPSTGSFTVDLRKLTGAKTIRITDVTGQLVQEQQVNGEKYFTFTAFGNGVYLLTVVDENNNTSTLKLISCR